MNSNIKQKKASLLILMIFSWDNRILLRFKKKNAAVKKNGSK